MKKRIIIALSISCLILGACSSGKAKETAAPLPDIAIVSESSIDAVASPSGLTAETVKEIVEQTSKARSILTGEMIEEEDALKRPIAIVINNIKKALPQSGISKAGIYYEVLAEGDITRIIAIFDKFDTEKIGPVRSARHYFIDFALNHDALFVHHGASDLGYKAFKTQKIDHLDGQFDDPAFWRDQARFKVPGMYEHSSYTNPKIIMAEAEKQSIRMNEFEDTRDKYGFTFNFEQKAPDSGLLANKVTVRFSPNYTSVFAYDETSKLYKKFQGTEPHIDEETGEQLAVSNILIQETKMHVINGDDAGRRDVQLIDSGKGFLATNGKYIPVAWKKVSHDSPTEWFYESGAKLNLNVGKTWICIYDGEPKFE